MRAVIADDHEFVRRGVRALFEAQPGWEVCGEAGNGQEAVDLAVKLKPDVVVLDISMPVMGGFQAARKIRQQVPGIKIVILSMHDSPHAEQEALKAGADAYVTKGSGPNELFKAIDGLDRKQV